MMITKPMLSGKAPDLENLSYPLLATPKLDGIRCLKVGGKVVSRTFKPIRNDHIRETLEALLPDNIDGEVMAGTTFQKCSSAVMSKAGAPDFKFHAFDFVPDGVARPYEERMEAMRRWHEEAGSPDVVRLVLPQLVDGPFELEALEKVLLAEGYEGVMVRDPRGPYKCGRSTVREGYLLKVKRFTDAEAEVIGFEELMHNRNEAKRDAFGRIERSGHQENKVPAGVLGKLLVRDLETGIEFGVGTGFDARQRKEYWEQREDLVGRLVKYKSFSIGVKEAPRHPVFLGWRDPEDL